MNGHLDVAQWLYSLDDHTNIHALNDDAMIYACSGGHLDMVIWLASNGVELDDNIMDGSRCAKAWLRVVVSEIFYLSDL
jgi:hypothetical protein